MIRDASGTITAGTTSQVALAANPSSRSTLLVYNNDAAESLFVNFGAVASLTLQGSIEIVAKGILRFDFPGAVPDESVNLNATTTGHKFTVKWG